MYNIFFKIRYYELPEHIIICFERYTTDKLKHVLKDVYERGILKGKRFSDDI